MGKGIETCNCTTYSRNFKKRVRAKVWEVGLDMRRTNDYDFPGAVVRSEARLGPANEEP